MMATAKGPRVILSDESHAFLAKPPQKYNVQYFSKLQVEGQVGCRFNQASLAFFSGNADVQTSSTDWPMTKPPTLPHTVRYERCWGHDLRRPGYAKGVLRGASHW